MDEFLTVEDVADRYRTTPSSVYKWVHKGTGPPSIRVGKRRLFAMADLIAWEQERRDEEDRERKVQRWKGVA